MVRQAPYTRNVEAMMASFGRQTWLDQGLDGIKSTRETKIDDYFHKQ
jgi:hypothetical protein